VTDRAQDVQPGDVFVAIRGARFDGHDHIPRWAGAAVVERAVEPCGDVVIVEVASTAAALGPLCAAREGNPSDGLRMIGVTGTNGKTSVTYLVAHFANAMGWRAGVVGTTGHMLNGERIAEGFTTPTAPQLQALFATFRDKGAELVAMEVSSIGLAAHRVDGTTFTAAGYTNLTRDHLDYHGTMSSYAAAKARLFTELLRPDGVAVINGADAACVAAVQGLPAPRVRAFRPAEVVHEAITGMTLSFGDAEGGAQQVHTRLIGSYNLENIACAMELGRAAGMDQTTMVRALESFPGVPGRLERVSEGEGFEVFVDYAHTDDALRSVISVLRRLTTGRLIVVFGCGGDRDAGKRPAMGAAAAVADVVVVTSDNPRSEDPAAIIADILRGVGDRSALVESDRREAIRAAIAMCAPGDVLLVAGKGHETTQTVGDTVLPFDDRAVCRALLVERRERAR
jgi:UDP-N-acetylmuramoyl-L-alanyl-D-glutamate--2,6-diaminopimelate ligase